MDEQRSDDLTVPAGLRPHPEGGAYAETWRSPLLLDTPRGPRATATAIAYLLEPGERSEWHRVRGAAELWVWTGGGRLTLRLGGAGDGPSGRRAVVLGPGDQHLVAADEWQSAEPVDRAVLCACVVSPGFDFADLELAPGPARSARRRPVARPRTDPAPPEPARTGPVRVLLLCEGNVHRSPMAAALLTARLGTAPGGPAVEVASAGVRTEPGMRLQPEAVDALAGRGVRTDDSHRSTPLTPAMAAAADVVLAATAALRDRAVESAPAIRDRSFTWRELVALAGAEPLTLDAASPRGRWEQLLAQARQRRGVVRPEGPEGFDVPDPVGRRAAVFPPLAADLDASMTALAGLLAAAVGG